MTKLFQFYRKKACIIVPGTVWDAGIVGTRSMENTFHALNTKSSESSDIIRLQEGKLNTQQLNLMLTHLPVDITYVDENDKVAYYSAAKDRVFPRTPAIIGRDVRNCHPPKSVHVVEKIVEAFKKKERKEASFWINMGEKTIYIQYFPMYDETGAYRGVIEVTQEVSGIKKLEGERRILDWE